VDEPRLAQAAGVEEPRLAEIAEQETDNWRLMRLAGLLRNTIHGAPIRAVGTSGHNRRSLVSIPGAEQKEILELVAVLGGGEAWGVRAAGRETYVEPERFTERLMPAALALLDQILAHTDIRRLPGVGPDANLLTTAPDEYPFSSEIRRRLRLLAGIDPGSNAPPPAPDVYSSHSTLVA
jgi:hypothetical protein